MTKPLEDQVKAAVEEVWEVGYQRGKSEDGYTFALRSERTEDIKTLTARILTLCREDAQRREERAVECLDCGRPYSEFGMDTHLPHSQWSLIHPDINGVICAQCIINRASKIPGATVAHILIELTPHPYSREGQEGEKT